jgi:hypothetical protein
MDFGHPVRSLDYDHGQTVYLSGYDSKGEAEAKRQQYINLKKTAMPNEHFEELHWVP